MFGFPGMQFSRIFSRKVPGEHLDRMEQQKDNYMSHKTGPVAKIFIGSLMLLILAFLVAPNRVAFFFKSYFSYFQ